MYACTFFGHREVSDEIEPILRSTLVDFIENQQITLFYVGNYGEFDGLVRVMLQQLQREYPFIRYFVVLAYLPTGHDKITLTGVPTLYPEGMEQALPPYAIVKRNQWMISHATHVIAYVRFSLGGAAQALALAQRKGKTVVNLADFV